MLALQRPLVQIQHPLEQWNLRGGNEAVLNTAHEIYENTKKIPLLWKFQAIGDTDLVEVYERLKKKQSDISGWESEHTTKERTIGSLKKMELKNRD